MKNHLRSISILSAYGLLALSSPFAAADEHKGLYFNADIGGSWADTVSLNAFPDAPPGGKVEFTPGMRMSAGAGYRVNDWFSAGGEMGYMWNGFKDADGYLSQTPFLANIEFRLPNKSRIVPFIGGGPGMSFNVIWLDDDSLGGGSRVDGSAGDAVFAWQAYGGLRFRINEYMSAGIVYKYFDAQSSEWDVDNSSQNIRFGKTHVHSISACFSMSY
jgi:opacity protein-like surface antigen